jgi:addiction module RelE/StbE family toxin
MTFTRSSIFKKEFKKLPRGIKDKAIERLEIFIRDPFDPLLNNHKLRYGMAEYRSINVTGNFRIVYKMVDSKTCFLVRIGNHNQLFGL